MSRATHVGHCQVCGSLQKLPNGRLSKHGYTRRWGFFEGVCSGAGELPWEVDCSVAKRHLEWAESRVLQLTQLAESTNQATDVVWVHEWVENSRRRGAYVWRCLKPEECEFGGLSVDYLGQDGRRRRVATYDVSRDEESRQVAQIRYLNAQRAAAYRKEAEQVQGYCKYQRARLAEWKPVPLTAVVEPPPAAVRPDGMNALEAARWELDTYAANLPAEPSSGQKAALSRKKFAVRRQETLKRMREARQPK